MYFFIYEYVWRCIVERVCSVVLEIVLCLMFKDGWFFIVGEEVLSDDIEFELVWFLMDFMYYSNVFEFVGLVMKFKMFKWV